MKTLLWWLAIFGAVGIAALADSVSTLWAKDVSKFFPHFFLLFFLGPLVFICFGYVTTRIGLAVTSGVVNSLLVLTSMAIGLIFFGEWSKVSSLQYTGMFLSFIGIVLMLFFPKNSI